MQIDLDVQPNNAFLDLASDRTVRADLFDRDTLTGMPSFPIRIGNTAPSLETRASYVDPADGVRKPFSFLGWTLTFTMETLSRVTTITGPAESPEEGVLRYPWNAGDTDKAGSYSGWFDGVGPNGEVQTFPTKGFLSIEVVPKIDP